MNVLQKPGLGALLPTILSLLIMGCEVAVNSEETANPTTGSSGVFEINFKVDQTCQGDCDPFVKTERCETRHRFADATSYCLGLRDARLNRGCARAQRKAAFQSRCGGDFDEFNIGGVSATSPNDPRGSCSWSVPDSSSSRLWCETLRDEWQHRYCGWDLRRTIFKQEGCEGSFSTVTGPAATRDRGVMSLNSRRYRFSSLEYKMFLVYRQGYRFRSDADRLLVISGWSLTERACEATRQGRLTAELVNLSTGQRLVFNPLLERPQLQSGADYSLTVDAENPGQCSEFHHDYLVEVI